MESSACRLTLVTLASAALGSVSVIIHPLSTLFLMVVILILPKYITITTEHGWMSVTKFTITTFCFGLIDGIALKGIIQFVEGGCEGPMPLFEIYIIFLTIFHYFEFQMVNCFHHKELTWNEFLICQNFQYFLALVLMLSEHAISKYFLHLSFKERHFLVPYALTLVIASECLRIAALFTCKQSFTHEVSYQKVETHKLVTKGVYSFFRHPAYTAYFYFTIGGQILLGNLVSTIVFTFVLIRYFDDRIKGEERALVKFFPEYQAHRRKTWVLIPFLSHSQKQN